jgi:hypothetical protein
VELIINIWKSEIKISNAMNFYPDWKRNAKGGEKRMETKTKVRIMGIILVVAAVFIETAAAGRTINF